MPQRKMKQAKIRGWPSRILQKTFTENIQENLTVGNLDEVRRRGTELSGGRVI